MTQTTQLSLEKLVAQGVKLTPMMKQYYEIKQKYPDHLLLFRMGDFYEVFFQDAHQVSQTLNIALTHRGKLDRYSVPMSGIPHHAAATYVDRLSSAGFKIAICDQVQDAQEAKGIVKRAVTRVVTPGLPFDLEQTDAKENYYTVAAFQSKSNWFLAVIDFTTGGCFGVKVATKQRFLETLRTYCPRELVTFPGQWRDIPEIKSWGGEKKVLFTHLAQEYFNPRHTRTYIEKLVPGHQRDRTLALSPEILAPLGALAYYIDSSRPFKPEQNRFFHLAPFRMLSEEGLMKVTLPTLEGLEILPAKKESYRFSLLGMMDKCITRLGSRTLKRLFLFPSTDRQKIIARLDFVHRFVNKPESLTRFRKKLAEVYDIERILAKVAGGKITAGDLHGISRTIRVWQSLSENEIPPGVLLSLNEKSRQVLNTLASSIETRINDEPGASLEKGNLIKPGADPLRDQLAKTAYNTQEELVDLENRYRRQTGIPKLKIKSNNVFGYFIEVSRNYARNIPDSFIKRQTLTGVERFTNPELSRFEEKIILAKERLNKLEKALLSEHITQIAAAGVDIQALAQWVGHLDAYLSLAHVSAQENFVRPDIVEEGKGRILKYQGLWHPLVKCFNDEPFTPHDLCLDETRYFGLITGPNMAGKTTVMREVVLSQVLVQIGSFVPAQKAQLSLCDHLFSRLGAGDDILQGQSTFMVEMSETAEILRHATKNSLIVLDEIGRGTSTYDGLAIAWALVEYLVDHVKSFTLFATHYHELIELVEGLDKAQNFTVETNNDEGKVKFLYRLIEGGATQSFGIYVAKLAGVPPFVLSRAQTVLGTLEKNENPERMFTSQKNSSVEPIPEYFIKLEKSLHEIDPLQMTPLEALEKLDGLKRCLGKESTVTH